MRNLLIWLLSLCLISGDVGAYNGFRGAPSANAIPIIARNIASGIRAPGFAAGGSSNGTDTSTNVRTLHYNESGQPISSLALVYCGWQLQNANNPNNGSEIVLPNSYTITASVEYPLGTFQQVLWSTTALSTVSPGANLISDTLKLSTPIPPNTQFAVRSYTVVSAGGVWPTNSTLASGETGNNGTPADLTMGGTISGSYSGNRPCGILSAVPGSKKVSGAGMGDSIVAGSGDGAFDSHGNTGFLGRAFSSNAPFVNISVVGTTLTQQVGHLTNRLNYLKALGITHVVFEYGINDGSSRTEPQMESDAHSFATSIHGIGVKVYETTLTPQASSTDGWLTTTNQTASGNNTTNNTFSTWVATTPAPLDGFIDNRTNAGTTFTSGLWKAGSSQTVYLAPNNDSWTASGSPTTTVIPSNNSRATNYYQGAHMLFTSGVNNGLFVGISNNTGSTFTLSSALGTAPSAGDTFLAIPFTASATQDGTHPANQGSGFGGVFVLSNGVIPTVQGWLQ